MKRFFGYDPVLGIERWFHASADGETFTIETIQHVEPIVEAAKMEYNAAPERWGERLMHKVASIPMALYADLKRKGIIDDEAAMKRWLNDSDNRHFRTRPGRV